MPRKSKSKEAPRRLKKKSRQEHKVTGSWNHQPEKTWSKLKAAMTLTARKE